MLQSTNITECCEPLPDPEGRFMSWDCCRLPWGQVVSTRLEHIWRGFAVELQQEDAHGAVFIPTKTWASGLTACCSATSLTPTSVFHAQGICSHMQVTCRSPMMQVFRVLTVSASCTLSFSYQNLVKMQGLWNKMLDLKHIFHKGRTLQSKE